MKPLSLGTRLVPALAALALLATPGLASDQVELIRRLDAKKGSEFLKKADWSLDYAKALQKAREHDRFVLAYFTRSYEP